jgi:hypothetical protein
LLDDFEKIDIREEINMKKISPLVSIIFLLSLLTACVGNNLSQDTLSDGDKVATIVAGTLSAIPSPSPMPTETPLIPTQTQTSLGQWLTWPPYIQKEKTQYLFQLEFDTSRWELKNDPTQNVYGFKRFEQYLINKQVPECAIIQTIGSGMSREYLVEDGQKNINERAFSAKSVFLNGELVFVIYSTSLNLDRSYENIFVVGGDNDCLASGELVLATIRTVNIENVTLTP